MSFQKGSDQKHSRFMRTLVSPNKSVNSLIIIEIHLSYTKLKRRVKGEIDFTWTDF